MLDNLTIRFISEIKQYITKKMRYSNFLKNMKECPFCNIAKDEVLKKNSFGKVILAKAPYHKDHLLVIPNKHALKISELTKNEKMGIFELILWSEKKIKKYHKNLSILYREGDKKEVGKSIDHMHINLIPDEQVGSIKINHEDRKVYSEKIYIEKTKDAKRRFK